MATHDTAKNPEDANNQLAENTLTSINDASTAGRALYTGFMALTAYIIVALGTTDDLQFFDREGLTLPLLNVEISLKGFYRYTPWLYVIVHANLLLLFSMIAEKHRYFAELADNCAWPERLHMRQQLHVNAFTQFLGAEHKGLLALILKLMIWFTIGVMPPLLLLAIQLDFLATQIESVTRWQQSAVLVDCFLAGFFWNNILQKARRARFPKDWSPPLLKRYLLEGWVLWVSVVFIAGFSWLVALVPLSDYERKVHNFMPEWEWLGLAKSDCVFDDDLKSLKDEIELKEESGRYPKELKEKLEKLENVFNSQLVDAAKEARVWTAPYRCSNGLTWWFIDRPDSWLNSRLEIRRWLNLPDKIFVENRKTVEPQWLNRLKSELGQATNDDKPSKLSSDESTSKPTNTVSSPRFKILDYFLPVNKEKQHFHFARFDQSFLPMANMKEVLLQGADLRSAKLQGADLRSAQLQGANLIWVKLQGADLRLAKLQGADLRSAQLQDANLKWAQLQDAHLEEAQLQGSNLREAQLQDANLAEAQLQGANLEEAQLQGANLAGAQLQGANLAGAQLQGANLGWAQLQGANLRGAQLQGANLGWAQLQGANLVWAQLQGANLERAQLQGANLERAQLQGANLGWAQLQGANLVWAQLQGANLAEAQLQGANLEGAQLQGAGLELAGLQRVLLFKSSLVGVGFYDAILDDALILDPLVEWKENDQKQLSLLKNNKSVAVNKESKNRLSLATRRMEIAKQNPIPILSRASLKKQDHRCLLLTDNSDLKSRALNVCDIVRHPWVNPLIHLRNWAIQSILVHCSLKEFTRIPFQRSDKMSIIDISKAYEIVKKYRTIGNYDMKLDEVSNALYELAYFFYNQQLIQIHLDKTKPCEARAELDVWYKRSGYENDPKLSKQILKLKLNPFPTEANQ